ncbi:SLBB domain-containing protein [Rhodohalobacter sp. 8-1]|uniref:SLBB domain-containing protein n=1 Tax=Rhodohalobacter sp. 8-1 TaxID=3131972 RepID=UPI0030ED6D5A
MSRRFIPAYIVLFILISPFKSLSQDISNSDQNRSGSRISGGSFETPSLIGQTLYFIDQVGLEFLGETVPDAEYFDRESYVIGPQDVININITGPVSLYAQALVVNSSGYLYIPYGGNVDVAGLTIDEATRSVENAVAKELVDFELTFHIQKPRPVQIQVIGDVPNPGRYLLPAGTRLDAAITRALSAQPRNGNALKMMDNTSTENISPSFNYSFRANSELISRDSTVVNPGLDENTRYSLRNIQIDHRWKSYSTDADLTTYYKTGSRESNPFLYDGDQIYLRKLNERSPRISISGAVDSPNEYEYRSDDTIQSLLKIAGGYTDGADTTHIILYRYRDGELSSETLSLNNQTAVRQPLQENDRLVVPYSDGSRQNSSAWVYGEAEIPGNFPIDNDDTTLGELIKLAGGLSDRALTNGAYLIRANMSNRGVQSATTLNTAQLMRTSDQVLQGFEYLEMERDLNSDQRMFIDLEDEQQLSRIRITDGDRVYIPTDYQNIVLYGQLNNPGNYPFNTSYTVRDYISQAGGLSLAANPDRIFVIKAGSRAWKQPGETDLESGDMIFVDRTPFDELNAQRQYEIQLRNARRNNAQLVLTAISTVAAAITTYVAITR